MGKLSRDKGKIGERQVAELIRSHGFEARRGQQFRGGSDSPDIIHNMVDLDPAGHTLHLEVKWRQNLNLYDALEKLKEDTEASQDAGDTPGTYAVFHRKDRKPWLVTLDANDFMEFIYCMHNHDEV